MSVHSYSRCWLHLIWATRNRERMLFGEAARKVSDFLSQYAESKGIFVRVNYVNPEHVHALIDLPTRYSIEEVLKLLKGTSSHWINQNCLLRGKFFWGRGYGVFSVSQSTFAPVSRYISTQEEHHRRKSFWEEYESLVKHYGLKWVKEETVETVEDGLSPIPLPLDESRG
ncbi:MAG TPA: IS200/IS605 family transposase [Terriglobia bacterium]|nr:IS200/IS605 family transposase [Terriglobia bacterium]